MGKKKDFQDMFVFEENNNSDWEENLDINSNTEYQDIISHSNKKHYYKKQRGILGIISKWWRNRKKWQKGLIISLTSVLLVLGILLGIFFIIFDYNYMSISKNPDDLGFENVIDKNIINVALFGIDTRDKKSFKGNSDSIMILSINSNTKQVKIISIMRDSFVPIQNNNKTSYKKINSAYASGGPELAIKTINSCFGMDISEYATVNFFGMADIIDAVGGIDVELTKKEVTASHSIGALNSCIFELCQKSGLNPEGYYVYKSGVQHLNGIQAVAYSRIRYVANIWGTNNDYGRTDRQRFVMQQLFNKALTLGKSKYVDLVKSLIPCTQTSLSYSEILGLAFDVLLKSPSFQQARVPQEEYIMSAPKTSAGSVVYYDLDFATKLIHAFIYDDITPDEYIETNGVEKNDWYKSINRGSASTSSKPSTSSSVQSSSKVVSSSKQEVSSTTSKIENEITSSEQTNSDNTVTSSENTGTQEGDGQTPDQSESQNSSSQESNLNSENSNSSLLESSSSESSKDIDT